MSKVCVSSLFAKNIGVAYHPRYTKGYAAGRKGATPFDVYYIPGLYNETTILHEALHTFLGVPDDKLNEIGGDGISLNKAGCNSLGKKSE